MSLTAVWISFFILKFLFQRGTKYSVRRVLSTFSAKRLIQF